MAQRAWRETRRHRGRSGTTWSKKAGARQSGQLQQEGGYAAALRGSSRAEQILLGFWAWSVCQMRQSYGAGPHAGRAGPCMLRACDRRVHCGGRVVKSRGSCPNREQGQSKAESSETVNRACRQKGQDKVEKISVHATIAVACNHINREYGPGPPGGPSLGAPGTRPGACTPRGFLPTRPPRRPGTRRRRQIHAGPPWPPACGASQPAGRQQGRQRDARLLQSSRRQARWRLHIEPCWRPKRPRLYPKIAPHNQSTFSGSNGSSSGSSSGGGGGGSSA